MQTNLFSELRQPLAVAYGMGVDSTAVLVEFARLGTRPDLIMFADVGSEKRQTYAYLPIINAFCESVGFPPVTVVRYVPQNFKNWPPYYSLEQNCLTNGTLPSISFSFQFKSCSQKWKAAPQNKFMKTWSPALEYWAAGGRVKKVIGYDDGTADQKRCNTFSVTDAETDEEYEYWYPLQDWKWDRERCKRAIIEAGLPLPPKSSCYFCAAMQTSEVDELDADYLAGIVRLEARARPRFKTAAMKGLWGRDSKKRPGSMTEYIRAKGLLPAEVIDRIIVETPPEIIAFQEQFAAGAPVAGFGEFANNQLVQITGGREGGDECQ